ncbi:hypothetical protein BJY52DRAFT_1232476 [Lactarius psammicola]|nr:hypothetical protein BJY52DRAFT_1232476 [Lactarius psammicola]
MLILQSLFLLALALSTHSLVSRQPGGAISTVKHLRHRRARPHAVFRFLHHAFTMYLVAALATKVELEVKVLSKIGLGIPDQPLDLVVECLRAARKHKLEISPRDSQGEDVAQLQDITLCLATIRSIMHRIPEYTKEAIYRVRTSSLTSPPAEQTSRLLKIGLKLTAERRSQYFGSIKGLEALSSNSSFSRPVPIVSFGEDGDDDPEFSQIHKTIELFEELLSGFHNNDMTKIDEAIEKGRTIFASHTIRKPLCPTVIYVISF